METKELDIRGCYIGDSDSGFCSWEVDGGL